MTEKLNWDSVIHCIVYIANDTTLVVPQILNGGGCMRPPDQLLIAWKMFGYNTFELLCRRKYKTLHVYEILRADETKNKTAMGVIHENNKIFSRVAHKADGKFHRQFSP